MYITTSVLLNLKPSAYRNADVNTYQLARSVPMLEGVTVNESKAQKDQIVIEGNDIETVSQSAADIHTACLVKNKGVFNFGSICWLFSKRSRSFCFDRYPKSKSYISSSATYLLISRSHNRQFLDGIYVEEKGHIQEAEAA